MGNDIHRSTNSASPMNQERDGVYFPVERDESAIQLFFRRAGEAVTQIASFLAWPFQRLAQAARNAYAQIAQAFSGEGLSTAVSNVRSSSGSRTIDFNIDDEISDEEPRAVDSDQPLKKNTREDDRAADPRDFFGLNEPGLSQDAGSASPMNTISDPDASKPSNQVHLINDAALPEKHEISQAENLFNQFSSRYSPAKGYSSIPEDDPAFDAACLEFAKQFQQNHPENARISYSPEIQRKRQAATALLSAEFDKRVRTNEKIRLAQERTDKLAEQNRRDEEPDGKADFEDFLAAFQAAEKKGRTYQFVEGSKFFQDSCVSYAQQRSGFHQGESSAITALLTAAGKSTPRETQPDTDPLVAVAVLPPAAPKPRWESAVRALLGDSHTMPEAYGGVLMPYHSSEHRNLAWEGLRWLLSPRKSTSVPSLMDEIEASQSYQLSSEAKERDLANGLELAIQLLKSLENVNVGSDEERIQRRPLSAAQVAILKAVQKVREPLIAQLRDGLSGLLPAKAATKPVPPVNRLPDLTELSNMALDSASGDFNAFVSEFSLANDTSQLCSSDAERSKYLRPSCIAVAQSVIVTFQHARELVDADRQRLMAALYLVNEFNRNSKTR